MEMPLTELGDMFQEEDHDSSFRHVDFEVNMESAIGNVKLESETLKRGLDEI